MNRDVLMIVVAGRDLWYPKPVRVLVACPVLHSMKHITYGRKTKTVEKECERAHGPPFSSRIHELPQPIGDAKDAPVFRYAQAEFTYVAFFGIAYRPLHSARVRAARRIIFVATAALITPRNFRNVCEQRARVDGSRVLLSCQLFELFAPLRQSGRLDLELLVLLLKLRVGPEYFEQYTNTRMESRRHRRYVGNVSPMMHMRRGFKLCNKGEAFLFENRMQHETGNVS